MVNDESLIREVDEGLAEDNTWRTMREHAPFVIGGAVAVIIGVAGWQIYTGQKAAAANEAARLFATVSEVVEAQPADAAEALSGFAEDAPGGYAAIAKLQLAALQASSGDRTQALNTYRSIYTEDKAGRLADIARLRAAYLSFADGSNAVMGDIGDLDEDTSPLGFFAREIVGLSALKDGDFEKAENIFGGAANSIETPAGVKARAVEFAALAVAGRQGIEIPWPSTGDAAPTTIFDAIDAEGGDLGALLQRTKDAGAAASDDGHGGADGHGPDDGHDHGAEEIAGPTGDVSDGGLGGAVEAAVENVGGIVEDAADQVGAAAEDVTGNASPEPSAESPAANTSAENVSSGAETGVGAEAENPSASSTNSDAPENQPDENGPDGTEPDEGQ